MTRPRCEECPTPRDLYSCEFYSPLLEKCDFPKKHDRQREMNYILGES